jgi:16S rRNA processing protein RimM
MNKPSDDDWVPLGHVSRAHGLKGEVKISLDGEGACLVPGAVVRIGDVDRVVEQARVTAGILRLQGITDRNAAELLKGSVLQVRRSQLPDIDDDEVYLADMVGLPMVDKSGRMLGTITGFTDNVAQPLALVRVTAGHEAMVPFVPPLVVEVRADAVVVDLPQGLLDADAAL